MPTPTRDVIDRICTSVKFGDRIIELKELQEMAKGRKIAYLFSGPARHLDAVELGKILGADVVAFDILRGEEYNLADQHLWDDIIARLRTDELDGVIMSPPCGTFSVARSRPGGPPPLRGESAPDIFGFKNLRPSDK